MILLVRVVLGSMALFFFAWGLRFVFTPDTMAADFFVAPVGTGGLSTIRGDLGGAFLAVAAFIALGLRRGATHWLHAGAILLGLIAAGRAVGFVFDGVTESALAAFVAEIVFTALLLIGARRLAHA
jgi:hypothetical protein